MREAQVWSREVYWSLVICRDVALHNGFALESLVDSAFEPFTDTYVSLEWRDT